MGDIYIQSDEREDTYLQELEYKDWERDIEDEAYNNVIFPEWAEALEQEAYNG